VVQMAIQMCLGRILLDLVPSGDMFTCLSCPNSPHLWHTIRSYSAFRVIRDWRLSAVDGEGGISVFLFVPLGLLVRGLLTQQLA